MTAKSRIVTIVGISIVFWPFSLIVDLHIELASRGLREGQKGGRKSRFLAYALMAIAVVLAILLVW
jgi:hypothetical protein